MSKLSSFKLVFILALADLLVGFNQSLSASSDSCACIAQGTPYAYTTCVIPCDVHSQAYDTGVYELERCEDVDTLIIESSREIMTGGSEKTISDYLSQMKTLWYYAQQQENGKSWFVQQYKLNVFAVDKMSIQKRKICRMYYAVDAPTYNNRTVANSATLVNSPLEGIEYLKMNSAGQQLQIIDMQGRSQLQGSSLVIFKLDSPLSTELNDKLTQNLKTQMSANMFQQIAKVLAFTFTDVNRSLGVIGVSMLDIQQLCTASITVPLKATDQCPSLASCGSSSSLWYRQGQYNHTFYYSSTPCYTQDYVLSSQGTGFLDPLRVNHQSSCNFTFGESTPVDEECVFPNFEETQPHVIAPPVPIVVPTTDVEIKLPTPAFLKWIYGLAITLILIWLTYLLLKFLKRRNAERHVRAEGNQSIQGSSNNLAEVQPFIVDD